MKRFLSGTSYLNIILTVIAILLALSVFGQQDRGMTPASSAWGQDMRTRSGFAPAGKSAPVDTSNVATVQDLAVAGAVSEVAAANREVASALRDLAKAVQDVGMNISRAMTAQRPGGTPSAQEPNRDIRVDVSR
jgi:hypothetical protein